MSTDKVIEQQPSAPAVAGRALNDQLGRPPKRGTVDRAEWLADKLHNGGDYGKEAAALLVEQAKELDYLRAVYTGCGAPIELCQCGYPMPCSVNVPIGFCKA